MKLKLYLLTTILTSLFSFGQNFTSGGINYVVTSATVPYTVAIGTHTNALGLVNVNIPETVENNGTTYSVTSIGDDAFNSCYSLTSINIGNSVTSIGSEVFMSCVNLTSVIVPNTVTSIGSSAFQNCQNLTNITLSNSLTSISNALFMSCSALSSITIPNSVTTIGINSFENCYALTSINIPNSVTTIDIGAFIGSGLISVTLSNSLSIIESDVFKNCAQLASISIPSSVNSIGISAFNGCSGLTSVSIPNSVTSIGESAFALCSSLTTLNIPSSVTSIGTRAFRSCTSLTSVTVNWATPLVVSIQTFLTVNTSIIPLNVPPGTVAAYQAAVLWQNFNITPPPVAATYLNFDGIDDHITVSNENNFDFTNQMTVEFWMQSSTVPEQWDTFIAKGDDSWRIALTATGTVAFAGTGAFTDFYSTTSVTDGNWHHVAVSYNGTNAIIYIDGILESSIIASGNIDNSSYDVSIGENLQQTGRFYNGNLDDIRIWKVARTAQEINNSKDCALRGNEANLVAYFKLNQGISTADNTAITTITDSTTNGNNGTLQNFSLNGLTSNFLAEAAPVATITYTIVQNNVSCNGLNDGSIIVTPVGGQAPYTFTWSNGNPNGTLSNLFPSTYNLYSITDANGCFIGSTNFGMDGNTLQSITITQPAVLGIPTVTTPVTYTQGITASALTATVGANGTSLLWYTTATGGTGDITAPTPSTVSPGNTSYWVSSTNANGCESARTEIVVTVNASATAGCWLKIDAGSNHTVAIAQNGTLWSWGRNSFGQLGLGDFNNRNTPIQVGTDTNWQSISCGYSHTIAIKSNGTLWSWGLNNLGQLGLSDNTDRNTPTQVGTNTNWQNIYTGGNFSFALITDGTLWSWGSNTYGQLGLDDTSNRNSPVQLGVQTDWQTISCGNFHVVALKSDGSLWSWGYNYYGQLALSDNSQRNTPVQVGTQTNWQSVSCGGDHTIALKTDGTLWSSGVNFNGQLGLGNTSHRNSFIHVGTDATWQSVACGNSHTVALKGNGTMWSWGLNTAGQLGLADNIQRNAPTQAGTDSNWKSVICGDNHSLAFKTDDTLWFCGRNVEGQLGLADNTNRNTPVTVDCSSILSTDNFTSENKVIIYPNPSNGNFIIETQEDSAVEVYDMIGKKVLSKKLSIGSSNLDLSNYTNGIYLLTVTNTNGGFKTFKLIKQ